ncbi:MAG TPA: PIN domain-containing protein [Acidimicrobiales bacterium]|nr:PIN domain-containing protein [Acidimicrobiales bacterium]
MATMGLRLGAVTDLPSAAAKLKEMASQRPNLVGSATLNQAAVNVDLYLYWVRTNEPFLKHTFLGTEISTHLRSPSYWAIRNGTTQVNELIESELQEQCVWLQQLATHIESLWERLKAAPGTPTVVDTNVLLHYQDPAFVNWREVTERDQVRLIVPLRVIEELDEKKWTYQRDVIRNRARDLLPKLWGYLADTAGAPVPFRDDGKVTIEVSIDDGPRFRTLDADQEILETCVDLKNVGQRVLLVTADTGISLRAVAAGISVVPMPDKYLRD